VRAVEIVERALERARTRAREAGVDVRLGQGDVTDLDPAHVESGFRLFLDTGTFHGLTDAQRAAMARGIIRIAAPAAAILVQGWERRHRGPLPRGTDRTELEDAFPGCETTDHGPTGFHAPPPIQLLMRPNEHWYRIRLG
jgi:hypothetical protein